MKPRTLGPVTAASSMGAAAGVVLVGAASRMGLQLSGEEAGAIIILATGLGGYLVPSPGRHL